MSIGFGGRIEAKLGRGWRGKQVWHPGETVEALAYDTPIAGWRGTHVNTLRLWSARALDPLRLDMFNSGDHVGALMDQVRAESISKVLYPGDTTSGRSGASAAAGVFLRLRLAAGSDCAAISAQHGDIMSLADKVAIQLNDTHPAIAVAELMQILVDLHDLPWEKPGRSLEPRSATPTTPCCRKRSRPGRCR